MRAFAMQPSGGSPPIQTLTGQSSREDTKRDATAGYSTRLILLATAGLLLARLPLIALRKFDPDELEHSHAAWCVSKGMLLYKDFFEHHTPWYYYTLRPFFAWFDVAGSFDSARGFLFLGRGLSFALTLLSLLLVWRIGRFWADRRVGLVAVLLLAAQPIFLQKTLEMCPDVLALPFLLAGIWLLLRGLADTTGSRTARGVGWFVGGGLAVGAAVMCTQKVLFVLPGMLAALGVWALSAETPSRRFRVLSIAAFLFGVGVPDATT